MADYFSVEEINKRAEEQRQLIARNQQNFDELASTKKVAYGAAQETTLAGNIFRYGEAIYNSATRDISFSDALRDIENERQRDIFKDNPEFIGISEQKEDAAVFAGRIGVAVADPVTWVFPWMKVAKAGKLAGAAAGAGFSATDVALRDKLVYGEVNPLNLGAATVIGGAAGALSGHLASKFRAGESPNSTAIKTIQEVMGDPDAEKIVSVAAPPVKYKVRLKAEAVPITQKEIDDIEEATRRVVTVESRLAAIPEATPTGTNLTMRFEPLNRLETLIKDVKALERLKDSTDILKTTKGADIVRGLERSLKRQQERETPDQLVMKDIQERLSFFKTELGRREGLGQKEYRKDIKAIRTELEGKYKDLQDKFMSGHIKRAVSAVDLASNVIEDLNKNNKLTQNMLKILISEPTRPIIGGIGGYVTAGVVGDEDDTSLMVGLIAAGAAAGAYQKAFQKLNLSAVDLETATLAVSDAAQENIKVATKIATSGTLATKSDALGGWNKILGNLLLQKPGGATNSVESTTLTDFQGYMSKLANMYGDSFENDNVVKTVTEVMRGWTDVNSLSVGYRGISGALKKNGLTQSDIDEVKRIAPLVTELNNSVSTSVGQAGIKFTALDNYGLAQLWDSSFIASKGEASFFDDAVKAFTIQYENQVSAGLRKSVPKPETIANQAKAFTDSIRGVERYVGSSSYYSSYNIFDKNRRFRPLSKNFEKHRLLTDTEATAFMAEKGWLVLDSKAISMTYADRAIKMRNFANVFGAEGELINKAMSNIDETFKGSEKLKVFGEQYRNNIVNMMEAYWGVYGKESSSRSIGTAGMALLTTLSNSTMLTRVSISALGDLIQPIQNSGIGPTIKSIMGRVKPGESFATQSGFKYDKSFEREYSALMAHGTDPFNSFQNGLNTFNRMFFKVVQLDRITKIARGFAYDVGIRRVFDISKKGKITDALQKEMNQLGISADDLKVVSKYKNVNEAFAAEDAQTILNMAGRRAADRDAIVPLVGNRLLFTQSGNPYVRSLGQFLSWAQAKTAQTNALVERIENKDVALAVRTAGLTTLYMGVQYLREVTKPSEPRKNEAHEPISSKHLQEALKLSGNILPWQVDKLVGALSSPQNKLISANISPSLSYADRFASQLSKAYKNMERGDYEGASKNLVEVLPFGKEVSYLTDMQDRPSFEKGGEVLDVPNVPSEPDQRIDKMTGRPYDQQAGTAFVDEEDPIRRLGFGKGGGVDPLRRLGFGIGSLVTRGVQKVVKALDDDVVEKAIKNTDEIIEEQGRVAKAIEAGEDPGPLVVTKEPEKTVTAYKLFRTQKNSDELFPLFVNADKGVSENIWIKAESGPKSSKKETHVKSKIGDLAYRPGWHSGDAPSATHIGGKSSKGLKKPDYRPAHQVWAEVQVPDDVDWQAEALRRADRTKKGDIISKTAHITDQLPERGFYKYKTNPNMLGSWLISGEMKVTKKLSREEQKKLEKKLGIADLPSLPEVIEKKKLKMSDLSAQAIKELKEFYPDVFEKLNRQNKFKGGKLLSSLKRTKHSKGSKVEDPSMYRLDGSKKSTRGFLGPMEDKDGKTMTEFSIGVKIDGKETEIPSLVPGLTKDEIASLKRGDVPESVEIKAKKHAMKRIKEGKSPFYQDGE